VKAIRVEKTGGPEVLTLQEVASPGMPGAGQALVRIMVAGVNFFDVQQRRGNYPRPLPYTPGVEASGIVESVGEGVTGIKPSARVAWAMAPGSYAEAAIVDAAKLIPLPDDFSFEQGAAFSAQGITAHYLLREFRKIKHGDVVLIHAAAGGLGLLVVQWAKGLGARVIGTVSTEEKARTVREAGADEAIIYTEQDFAVETMRLTGGHGADLVLDSVGKTTFAKSLEAAAVRGHVVCFGSASGPADPIAPNALMVKSLSVSGGAMANFMRTREEVLWRAGEVISAVQRGLISLAIDRVFPLADAAEAHRQLEGRKSSGKLLLETSSARS